MSKLLVILFLLAASCYAEEPAPAYDYPEYCWEYAPPYDLCPQAYFWVPGVMIDGYGVTHYGHYERIAGWHPPPRAMPYHPTGYPPLQVHVPRVKHR